HRRRRRRRPSAIISTARPARTISAKAAPSPWHAPKTAPCRRKSAIRTTPRHGARSGATNPVPAVRARNTSTATARLPKRQEGRLAGFPMLSIEDEQLTFGLHRPGDLQELPAIRAVFADQRAGLV